MRRHFPLLSLANDPFLAMGSRGAAFASGRGVPQDHAKARQWFEKAADKGDDHAMDALGEFYRDGARSAPKGVI